MNIKTKCPYCESVHICEKCPNLIGVRTLIQEMFQVSLDKEEYSSNIEYQTALGLRQGYKNSIEIIEKPTVPTINGYEMEEINRHRIKFGCYEFGIGRIKNLYKTLIEFNSHEPKITSIDIGGEDLVNVKDIKKVVEYLNSNK